MPWSGLASKEDRDSDSDEETGFIGLHFPSSAKILTPDKGITDEIPIFWPPSVNDKYRCIYRVPSKIRIVNPEAYTPKMLLIGPLHSSKSSCSEYEKMEQHKKKYLEHFKLVFGNQSVEELRRIIEKDEKIIRAHYAEPTDWIRSHDFVEMILHDSVFILVFFWQFPHTFIHKTGDFLMDEPIHESTILQDLILLENQLPYSLLEDLFEPLFEKFNAAFTFRDLLLESFQIIVGNFKREIEFLHFTDILRSICVQTLGLTKVEPDHAQSLKMINNLYNAQELNSAGVKFVSVDINVENEMRELPSSLVIKFEDGTLKISSFIVTGNTGKFFSNIMALEQCHYPLTAFVCNYVNFLDLFH